MSHEEALHLGDIDPPRWRVKVNDRVYGPYTLGQMQTFRRERRIGPNTLVETEKPDVFRPASTHKALSFLFEETGAKASDAAGDPANYLIVAQLDETLPIQLVEVLNSLGKFADVMPRVWALRSAYGQGQIRDCLQAAIGPDEQVMIANATTGRLAWLNLGPDADAHIQRIWDAEIKPDA
ncbi:GYF domain-containing protein [Henriciella sp.]|uniref:GYF domain-containing protein n=1 Tax=Henriciella sp. TaxID=1968823 RepID=UPI0026105F67|nr:GYF domain-containing protein [Henriciella sp.]